MAKPVANPTARLRKLTAALAKAQALKRGEMFSAGPMSQLLGVSWKTLREWCEDIPGFDQSGAFTKGGNGIEWEFKPAATVRFLLKHFTKIRETEAVKNRKIRKAVGVTMPDSEDAASFQETKDLVNMTVTVVSAAEKQGGYTPTEEMVQFMSGYNQRVVAGIMGVRTSVDPNGNLPPSVRQAIDEYLRSVATHVHEDATEFIREHRARLQQAGAG